MTLPSLPVRYPAECNRKANVAREFDRWAPTYEQSRLSGWYQAQNALALAHLSVPHNGHVLDIGCGTGWALRELAHRNSGLTAFGLDISDGMIAAARERADTASLPNLHFHKMDWENGQDALPERKFDAILCISAFHYFADPLGALKRMRKILTEGGQLLIVERAMDGSLLTRIWNAAHRWLIRDHVSFASSRQLVALAHEADFAKTEIAARINRLFWKNKAYTSLVLIKASTGREIINVDKS